MAHRDNSDPNLREQLVVFEGMVGALERALHFEESKPIDCVKDANRTLDRLVKTTKKGSGSDQKSADAMEPYLVDYEHYLDEVSRDLEFERWTGAEAKRYHKTIEEGLKLILACRQATHSSAAAFS